jgi:hypothetical protein
VGGSPRESPAVPDDSATECSARWVVTDRPGPTGRHHPPIFFLSQNLEITTVAGPSDGEVLPYVAPLESNRPTLLEYAAAVAAAIDSAIVQYQVCPISPPENLDHVAISDALLRVDREDRVNVFYAIATT